jgi:hypothetical protein
MAKARIPIPAKISEKVLKEFNHRCAKCGTDNPHLHHIDENPSNNDPLNLIPLCPNCHLVDQHNPTRLVEPGKLRLFRIYKDPAILKPQFHALYIRFLFFESAETTYDIDELERKAIELLEFILTMEKGEFYAKVIGNLILPSDLINYNESRTRFVGIEKKIQRGLEYHQQLQAVKERVYELIIELLRFQSW